MNLGSLPSDIIRQIIGARLECIQHMRLISRRWNDLGLVHLTFRQRLPSIESFRWHLKPDLTSTIAMVIRLSVLLWRRTVWKRHQLTTRSPVCLSYYRYLLRQGKTVEVTSPIFRPMFGLFWGFSKTYEQEMALWERIIRLLRRCSRIKQLFLFPGADKSGAFDMFRMAMDDVVVDELFINGIPNLTEHRFTVLQMLRPHPIKMLFISIVQYEIYLENFFTQATRLLPTVRMVCTVKQDDEEDFHYLKRQLLKIRHFKTKMTLYPKCAHIEVIALGNWFQKGSKKRV